jgi:hypothetical protein
LEVLVVLEDKFHQHLEILQQLLIQVLSGILLVAAAVRFLQAPVELVEQEEMVVVEVLT